MNIMQMTNEELTRFANQVKDLIAERFEVEGLMSCAVVLVEKGMFGKAWDMIFGAEDNKNTLKIRLMRDVVTEDPSIKTIFTEGITAKERQSADMRRLAKEGKKR